MRVRCIPGAAFAAVVLSTSAIAADEVRGPVQGQVVRAIDGDTLEFVAHVWLGLDLTTHVRVRGIDAPEVAGKCAEEKAKAAQATKALGALIAGGVTISNVSDDKYFGRVVADVTTLGGTDVRGAMIASGLARPYDGGTRLPWCPVAAAQR